MTWSEFTFYYWKGRAGRKALALGEIPSYRPRFVSDEIPSRLSVWTVQGMCFALLNRLKDNGDLKCGKAIRIR